MSGSISIPAFEQIPTDWRVPGTYVEVRPTYTNLGVLPYPARALLIGQMRGSGAGTATALRAYPITRLDQAIGLFGAGSQLARMCATFLAANGTTPLFAMAVADPSGAAATGTFAITGSPTAAGTLAAYIAGTRVAVPVSLTDTPTAIAARLRDAINANTALPVTAAATTGTVTVTARNVGVIGNSIDLRINYRADELTPGGLTVTVTAMASGSGVVDITSALSAFASDWYTDIALGWSDATNMALLETDLARRYGAMGRLDAHAYVALAGTYSALGTYGAARNSQFVTCLGMNGMVSEPWAVAASLAGVCAFQLANDPARQLRGLALPGIAAPPSGGRFIESERDGLLRDGISTFLVGQDGTVTLERVITMYQKTGLGVDDTAWLDIMIPKTLSRIRHDWRTWVSLQFPRHKLADDGALGAEFSPVVVTPRILHSSWGARCTQYERLGWTEATQETVAESSFVRDPTDRNRVNSRQVVRIIGNLMVLAVALEFEA